MPELVCSAQSCVYNNAMYCSRGDIEVGGRNATVCQDTCCESFKERQGTSASNSMGTPSANTDIRCEAEHCQYNQNCCCSADHVDVSGAAACRCEETECTTFIK